MTPRELRQSLRDQKRAIRESMHQAREQARRRLGEIPAVQRERKRRRVRRALGVALLLLLACLIRCQCDAPRPLPKKEGGAPAPIVKHVPPAPAPKKPRLSQARAESVPRGSYPGNGKAPPTWLDELHLQVAARSTRLAQCFAGAERPGALRWMASLNPESGVVSDQQIEPIGASADIPSSRRDCLVQVLSSPAYHLSAPSRQALPGRISMVIEF